MSKLEAIPHPKYASAAAKAAGKDGEELASPMGGILALTELAAYKTVTGIKIEQVRKHLIARGLPTTEVKKPTLMTIALPRLMSSIAAELHKLQGSRPTSDERPNMFEQAHTVMVSATDP